MTYNPRISSQSIIEKCAVNKFSSSALSSLFIRVIIAETHKSPVGYFFIRLLLLVLLLFVKITRNPLITCGVQTLHVNA